MQPVSYQITDIEQQTKWVKKQHRSCANRIRREDARARVANERPSVPYVRYDRQRASSFQHRYSTTNNSRAAIYTRIVSAGQNHRRKTQITTEYRTAAPRRDVDVKKVRGLPPNFRGTNGKIAQDFGMDTSIFPSNWYHLGEMTIT